MLIVQIYFSRIGQSLAHLPEFELYLQYDKKSALDDVLRYCKDKKLAIKNLQITSSDADEGCVYNARLFLNPNKRVEYEELLARIRGFRGVVLADIAEDEGDE